jgi:hypothetical protein
MFCSFICIFQSITNFFIICQQKINNFFFIIIVIKQILVKKICFSSNENFGSLYLMDLIKWTVMIILKFSLTEFELGTLMQQG